MSWTTNDATDFVAEIHPDLAAIGCDVGIYGSVARGEMGNDLDLVVWAPDGRGTNLFAIADVFERHGASQTGTPYGGGPESYFNFWRYGQKIHVRVLTGVGVPADHSGPGLTIQRNLIGSLAK